MELGIVLYILTFLPHESANHIVRDIIHPNQSPANGMIEAPPRNEEASDSDHED